MRNAASCFILSLSSLHLIVVMVHRISQARSANPPAGIAPNSCGGFIGVFETDLNRQILKGARGQEFLMRTPMGRFGRVEELVGAAVYLASDAATFVTGQMIAVDGGFLASGVNQ